MFGNHFRVLPSLPIRLRVGGFLYCLTIGARKGEHILVAFSWIFGKRTQNDRLDLRWNKCIEIA